jgi:hypothetical protein
VARHDVSHIEHHGMQILLSWRTSVFTLSIGQAEVFVEKWVATYRDIACNQLSVKNSTLEGLKIRFIRYICFLFVCNRQSLVDVVYFAANFHSCVMFPVFSCLD